MSDPKPTSSLAKNRGANNILVNGIPHVTLTGSRIQRVGQVALNGLIMTANTAIGLNQGLRALPAYIGAAEESAYKYLITNPTTKTTTTTTTKPQNNTRVKDYVVNAPNVNTPIIPPQLDPDGTYSWNLPPHKWSLPLDPSNVSNTVKSPRTNLHTKRRGLIFLGRKYNGVTKTSGQTGNTFGTFSSNYGFQFLWNPETFSQSTSVNWGITPNQNDVGALLTGLVSANSTLDFTLRIDRTNDFACAKTLSVYSDAGLSKIPELAQFNVAKDVSTTEIAKFYIEGKAPNSEPDFAKNIDAKIKDLLKRGTEADLEFLYRTINGDGYNLLGVNTSNISFLLPTIVRIDLGPQRLVGMIQSLNVTHLAFTREMIPIRSDVTLSIDLRTATQITTSNLGGTDAQLRTATGQQ